MNQYDDFIPAKAGIQRWQPHFRRDGRRKHRFLMLMSFLLMVFAMTACGFHLRGAGRVELAPVLSALRVTVEDNTQLNNSLATAMKQALRTQTTIQVQDSGDVPLLVLFGERTASQVLSVELTGKVDEYLLRYEVSFRLVDVHGKMLAEPQTVRLQRDHVFDRLNVSAKEKEEQDLRRVMQEDAVQQILRRLSRISLIVHANQP